MGLQSKSANLIPPYGDGTAVTSVRLYTAETTSKADALPADFHGQFIRVFVTGGDLSWFLTKDATAAVDKSISATDAGASSAELGDFLPNNAEAVVFCPYVQEGETIYLVREASASSSVYIRKASGPMSL